jgi:hypothetical protein
VTRLHPFLALCSIVGALARPAPAEAQTAPESAAKARALFDEAQALVSTRDFAKACPKLEESQALAPSIVTKYRLAQCHEATGRIATAWSLFSEVADEARRARQPEREAPARKRADALKARVPTMTIAAPPALSTLGGLEIRRNGVFVREDERNRPVPVDPGKHVLVVSALGKIPWQATIEVTEGASREVHLPMLQEDAAQGPGAEPGDRGRAQRIGGIAVGAAGVGAIGLGLALGVMAKSQWDGALSLCPARDHCPDTAVEASRNAVTSATAATVAFAAGGVALAGGVVLWLLAPRGPAKQQAGLEIRVFSAVGRSGSMAVVQGRF